MNIVRLTNVEKIYPLGKTEVLADEPTANLDSATGEAIISLMKKINREMNTTFIFSTHDAAIVQIADHIIRLLDGKITETTRTESLAGV